LAKEKLLFFHKQKVRKFSDLWNVGISFYTNFSHRFFSPHQRSKNMISQDLLNLFSIASIVSALLIIAIYFLFLRKK